MITLQEYLKAQKKHYRQTNREMAQRYGVNTNTMNKALRGGLLTTETIYKILHVDGLTIEEALTKIEDTKYLNYFLTTKYKEPEITEVKLIKLEIYKLPTTETEQLKIHLYDINNNFSFFVVRRVTDSLLKTLKQVFNVEVLKEGVEQINKKLYTIKQPKTKAVIYKDVEDGDELKVKFQAELERKTKEQKTREKQKKEVERLLNKL